MLQHELHHLQPSPRRGATAVEFAVIAPAVFMVVFGIFEFGRAFMAEHLLTEIARRACRYAVVAPAPNNTNAYITSNIIDPEMARYGMSGYAVDMCVTPYGTPLSTTGGNVADAVGFTQSPTGVVPGSAITVRISVPAERVSWIPPRFLAATGSACRSRCAFRMSAGSRDGS